MVNNTKNIPPFSIVIFGVTGDLSHRKLLPALYNLFAQGSLPEDFNIVGFARRDWTDEVFRTEMRQSVDQFSRVKLDAAVWDKFAPRMHYVQSDFDQFDGYDRLH